MKQQLNKLQDGLTVSFNIVINEKTTYARGTVVDSITFECVGFELCFSVKDKDDKAFIEEALKVINLIVTDNRLTHGLLSGHQSGTKPHSYVGHFSNIIDFTRNIDFKDELDLNGAALILFTEITKQVNIPNIIKFLLMLEDFFVILNKYNAKVTFNSRDVIQALAKEYGSLEEYHYIVPELNKLISVIDNHKKMEIVDVIMQYYAWKCDTIITNLDELLRFIDNHTLSVIRTEKQTKESLQLNELNMKIDTFHDMNLLKFYMPALGTVAYDKSTYHWNYTEYKFFTTAKPQINEFGEMYIDILTGGGKEYYRIYAQGQKLHNDFEPELKHLAEYGGTVVKFKPDCKFHTCVEFTKESSVELQKMNFHMDLDFVKAGLWRRNTFTILTLCKERSSPFLELDIGIIKKIIAFIDFKKPIVNSDKPPKGGEGWVHNGGLSMWFT